MRLVRSLLFFAGLGAAALGLVYLYFAKDLPGLAEPAQISAALERRVEAERIAVRLNGGKRDDEAPFEILPKARLPKGLVLGLLALEGCPEYLEAPAEQGSAHVQRVLGRLLDPGGGPAGPGRCRLRFADQVAKAIGVVGQIHATIADHKILTALSTEQLLTYRLASTYYAPGVIGARAASRRLFGVDPGKLDLARSAELLLAEGQFEDFVQCTNPAQLKLLRDDVLARMAAFGVVGEGEARSAKARPLGCTARRH